MEVGLQMHLRDMQLPTRHLLEDKIKFVKQLFLWMRMFFFYCMNSSLDMPVAKYTVLFIESYDPEQFEYDVINNKIFGFFEVDIKVPDNLREYFSEMTPTFRNCSVSLNEIGKQHSNMMIRVKHWLGNKQLDFFLLYNMLCNKKCAI